MVYKKAIENCPFIVDLPIKNCDFPVRYVNLPEGSQFTRRFPSFSGAKQINEIPPSAILSSRQPIRLIDH